MSEDVTLALSELRNLITKAARGAGLSWGMAEEAGWAAEWLARRGMPAADWATVWLAARINGAVSPVEVGAALADAFSETPAGQGSALPDGLSAPGYLLPFLHRMAETGVSLAIASGLGQVASVSCAGEVTIGPAWAPNAEGWHLSRVRDTGSPLYAAARPRVSHSVIACLEGLALRTTVPRSETSRKDAGSLGDDND